MNAASQHPNLLVAAPNAKTESWLRWAARKGGTKAALAALAFLGSLAAYCVITGDRNAPEALYQGVQQIPDNFTNKLKDQFAPPRDPAKHPLVKLIEDA